MFLDLCFKVIDSWNQLFLVFELFLDCILSLIRLSLDPKYESLHKLNIILKV